MKVLGYGFASLVLAAYAAHLFEQQRRIRRSIPEPIKAGETTSHADLMSASGLGSLIQATVGSFGGVGRWWRNRTGLAA